MVKLGLFGFGLDLVCKFVFGLFLIYQKYICIIYLIYRRLIYIPVEFYHMEFLKLVLFRFYG